MTGSEPGFLHRTRHRITRTGEAAVRRLINSGISPQLSDKDARSLEEDIRAAVSPSTGEVSVNDRVIKLAAHYEALDAVGQQRFFELLGTTFGLRGAEVSAAIAKRQRLLDHETHDRSMVMAAEREIRHALVPPRENLFKRFNGLDHGVKFVVDLRADLRSLNSDNPEFKAMDLELKELLAEWFHVGNLELRQISWNTPASLLERLIAYESVHEIESWNDLKNRLDSDRRCYAFFHPGMPEEPLIFVEVALVNGLAGDLGQLLDLDAPALDPNKVDTAIFYSISSCQDGLAGVNLGNMLIKRVVAALLAELPQLKVFSTLSPIPGFRSWLTERFESRGTEGLTEQELVRLQSALNTNDVGPSIAAALSRPDWPSDTVVAAALKAPLLRLCSTYLLEAKRGSRALDRVANFHLSNGSRVERLNWLANTSEVGLDRSAGIMVNYRYLPDNIEANHAAYFEQGDIAASGDVKKLLSA